MGGGVCGGELQDEEGGLGLVGGRVQGDKGLVCGGGVCGGGALR